METDESSAIGRWRGRFGGGLPLDAVELLVGSLDWLLEVLETGVSLLLGMVTEVSPPRGETELQGFPLVGDDPRAEEEREMRSLAVDLVDLAMDRFDTIDWRGRRGRGS